MKRYEIDNNFKTIGIESIDYANEANIINQMYQENDSDILVLTSSLFEANKLYDILISINDNTLFFPMDDFLTSEAVAISPEFKTIRINTLNNLVLTHDKKIVITHLMGVLRFLPTKNNWQKGIITLKKGDEIDYNHLLEDLYDLGYIRSTIVENTGEIGVRGFVIDIFPIQYENPIRIELWGDTIDSIRSFDIETQKSIMELNSVTIYAFTELLGIEKDENTSQRDLYKLGKSASLLEYLNSPIIFFNDYSQIKLAYCNLEEQIFNYEVETSKKGPYLYELNTIKSNKEVYILNVDNIIEGVKLDKVYRFNTKELPKYNGNYSKLNEDMNHFLNASYQIIISVNSRKMINNLEEYLTNYVITSKDNLFLDKINIVMDYAIYGYQIDKLIVLTERELNNKDLSYKHTPVKYYFGRKVRDINKLALGDYVVHQTHGIGIYEGVTTLTKCSIKKDYVQIGYKNNDKLYIPVEKIDLISKYSGKEGQIPKINSLGGTEWAKLKQRVRNKVKDIAGELIKIYAMREKEEGFSFAKDTKEQLDFEREFNYIPTEDQLIAVEQIKKDMENKNPMDRLLCGDVGFGKTEVAFRAIFKAVDNSKQVAYLCPTTILSKQHYNNAITRFQNYPFNIALLNRFTSIKEKNKILEDLKRGTIDILIGTHRLLSKDVMFKDLGLLVIDEEQRFGVMHKERIKEIKATVDVLTLSATPIPRTLQMSMSGLKSLSLIETPPVNRYPVQTYVLGENTQVIKEAIYKELSRKGQVFILYNKVDSILKEVNKIKELVKEARVTYAHGKMNKQTIENTMQRFIDYEADVLVCTTIIETGIDIPNVNTLIIIDADRFGLAQLYQIRGRVGRSDKIAYAYLMYNERKVLSETAIKRLKVIKEFTELGSGFSIAMRDLSIRGAGDILGSEQAGFIDSIGVELYLKILDEEVKRLSGIIPDEEKTVENEMPLIEVDTHIEDKYVDDTNLKIEIHKLINEIDSKEKLDSIRSLIEDRFGIISEEMEIYMYEEWFEKLATIIGIEKVNKTKTYIELILNTVESSKIKGDQLFMLINDINRMFRLSFSNKRIHIILDTVKLDKHYIYYLVTLCNKMIEKKEDILN